MIYSMTAFAQQEISGDVVSTLEMRSVNQRFLELNIRLPEILRFLEPKIRDMLKERLTRGKIELNIKLEKNSSDSDEYEIDKIVAKKAVEQLNYLAYIYPNAERKLSDLFEFKNILVKKEQDVDVKQLEADIMQGIANLLDNFIAMREREGEKIKQTIIERLDAINVEVEKVSLKMPEILNWQRERFISRFEEYETKIDPERLEQEMLIIAQKTDVAEELDRLKMHISETYQILEQGGAVGRRLDFMMQEFNREANTLGSKSISNEITKSSVEIKVLIEQMREQIQNVE